MSTSKEAPEHSSLVTASDVRTPSLAERARSLLHAADVGTLATQSKRMPGFPFASLVLHGTDGAGRPTFLLSSLAVHTENLVADRRASFLVAEPAGAEDSLAQTRVTAIGEMRRVAEAELAEVRAAYLERHPSAERWASFGDFAFYRLEVSELYCVAGFGEMGWVDAAQYAEAEVDPLTDSAAGILSHMNQDHADALVLYCRAFADVGAEEATMTAIDRWGFRVRASTPGDQRSIRIGFPREVRTTKDARMVLVEMLRDARARLGEAAPSSNH